MKDPIPKSIQTIASTQESLQKALETIATSKDDGLLPPALEPLTVLAGAPGLRVRVSLRHRENARQIRSDAAAANWDPSKGEIVISFEAAALGASSLEEEPRGSPHSLRLTEGREDLIRLLDRAERERHFVALKWFRDQVMLELKAEWVADGALRQEAIRKAIEDQLFLTGKTANPKAPSFPVTTIRLNRSHPEVLAVRELAQDSEYEPQPIAGEELSRTILRDRR